MGAFWSGRMKTITLTDFEAEVLAHYVCERLHRLDVIVESTTQMAVLDDAEIQRKFCSLLLKQLGYKQEDLENWGILLKRLRQENEQGHADTVCNTSDVPV